MGIVALVACSVTGACWGPTKPLTKADTIRKVLRDNKVVVYSKSYCPYCARTKALFKQLQVPAHVIELNEIPEGDQWQSALTEITGRRTVPQVFIGGELLGGSDDTLAAQSSGKLKDLLSKVGIKVQATTEMS